MTTLVEQMNDLRRGLEERAAHAGGSFAPVLRAAAAEVDTLRRRIVATKEGGMITGEERLREHLTGLYGSVIGYEGRPSQTQMVRADAIARELGDVSNQFTAWIGDHLAPINTQLKAQGLPAIDVRTP